ncbi:MAG: MCE-family protein MCE3A, partial [Acidimicrobiia bacterium]
MDNTDDGHTRAWAPLILVVIVGTAVWLTYASFTGALRSTVPVTVTSDRAGLVLETNAKVKLRGVEV